MKNRIIVVGIGYVGLVSAACLSDLGHSVTCLDIDETKIANLREGVIPIFEPGIEDLVIESSAQGRLSFTTSYQEAFASSPRVAIIAVDTPTGEKGQCDTTRVEAVARSLGKTICGRIVIVIKSTVPVGTNRRVKEIIDRELEARDLLGSFDVDVVSNPEFLREGAAKHDFMQADRIILGVRNERSEEVMRDVYAPLLARNSSTKIITMDPESSELTKYAANTMLALRISFMNWLSHIASKSGANIESIREGIGSDRRIGNAFLQAGLGFGGSCFPKDIRALRQTALDLGIEADLIDAIEAINTRQRMGFADQVLSYLNDSGAFNQGARVGIWGLSFKPNTDDMREAPSLDIIKKLSDAGVYLKLFDPIAMENAEAIARKSSWYAEELTQWCSTPLEAATDVDALLIVTEWELFSRIDKLEIKKAMRGRALFDGRNLFSSEEMERIGFHYVSIGRPNSAYAVCEKEGPEMEEVFVRCQRKPQ